MDNIEDLDDPHNIKNCESVYLKSSREEHSEAKFERRIKQHGGLPTGTPGTSESWEESSKLLECESVYLDSKASKKKSRSRTKDEEEIDLMMAKSQSDLDALMERTAGSIDLLLDKTSEKMDEYLLDKPIDRKKSKKYKESNEVTEDFGAKPERKKSKKFRDKEVVDENGEEDGQTGDGEKKKKKRKKGAKSTATSCATSCAPSRTASPSPTEVDDSNELQKCSEPQNWGRACVPMTYEKPYRVPVADRFKQITRDVHKLDTTIHNLYEKEKLYKIRMLQQKYWHKPDTRLYSANLDFQGKPYNKMMNFLDRKERGLISERESHRLKSDAFVSDYDKRITDSRMVREREEMEEARVKRILSAPSPRDVIFSSKSHEVKHSDTLKSKQVQTDVSDVFIPHGPNQCIIPTTLSRESSASMSKEVQTYNPVSQSVQTDTPITLSLETYNPTPVELKRPVSDVDNNTLAIAASMTKLAASRLEEARFEREREDKLLYMNNKLMDSLNALGRCVENLAVDRSPVRVNQYHAVPNVAFYQEQLARLDADTKKYKNQYLEQEPLYTPGNMSYHEHPFENIKETNHKRISYDNYTPCYKETGIRKHCITDEDVTTMLNEINSSRNRNRARTMEDFEEQEKANVFIDKFDPNWKFDTSLLENKDMEKATEIVHSNYMRVRHAQLRASQRNAIHGH